MLAQHIITKPIFEALFEGYSFVKNNAVSTSMQIMLDALEADSIAEESETLQKFYESVRKRAEGIDNAEGKQRIIVELYDKFFKAAFPKMVEQLGIVYTPVEVVDFIIHSVNDVLKQEFGRTLSDENIHILDPFTGTGTFITRLLQSGLIEEKDLDRKYQLELHANEIVLLAYYIAAINIENAYHDATPDTDDGIGKEKYFPFEGIVLTDTFQLGETDNSDKLFSETFPQNTARVEAQKKAPLRVIMGNPPYSVGQQNANDNAANQKYEKLENRIKKTYANESTATNQGALYDAYIKAFRWSTDRLDPLHGGIIAFVSNGAWLDGNSTDGFRNTIEKEFSSIWVFNLRGNQRTSGELSRQEGGKIFGSGSRTPIAITLLVKNPNASSLRGTKQSETKATIHYHDIGDYLSQQEKLTIIGKFRTVANPAMQWLTLQPNEHGDWISQRNDLFGAFIPVGDKKVNSKECFFVPFYSNGVKTNRDAWVYNFNSRELKKNMIESIRLYSEGLKVFQERSNGKKNPVADDFIDFSQKMITWTREIKWDIEKGKEYQFEANCIVTAIYRPFVKQRMYFNKGWNNMQYQIPKLFPNPTLKNLVICVSGVGVTKDFSCIITDTLPDLELIGKSQCFPLYYYEERQQASPTLFDATADASTGSATSEYIRRDGVSDFILERAKKQYSLSTSIRNGVSKEDIFYYVYGILHSPDYRTAFANDLKKMLPRIPLVEDVRDFWKFSKAGRQLAELHINYESVPPFDGVTVSGAELLSFIDTEPADTKLYHVEKMRFPKKGQKETIIYNSHITIENIPAKAYEYVVNGKSAIEWIMERYKITTHKDSGITNNPNDWATEVGNPRYILDLLLSIINVSVQTVEIVEGLPELKFEEA